MKPEQLIPLNQVSREKLRKLFDENFNFAWNVRHYVEDSEAFFFQEMFKEFGDARVEWEFGLYTKCKFSVNHDPASLRAFTIGCFKILKDYNFFNDEDANYIDALGIAEQAYENCEPEKEDEILEKAYVLMDAVANLIAGHLRKSFAYWESDERVFEERMDDFIECYGEDIYLDPATDKLMEFKSLGMWDF